VQSDLRRQIQDQNPVDPGAASVPLWRDPGFDVERKSRQACDPARSQPGAQATAGPGSHSTEAVRCWSAARRIQPDEPGPGAAADIESDCSLGPDGGPRRDSGYPSPT